MAGQGNRGGALGFTDKGTKEETDQKRKKIQA